MKTKNMSSDGIRPQQQQQQQQPPRQQQSPPPEVNVKKSPIGSVWHTGRSWISPKSTAFTQKTKSPAGCFYSPLLLALSRFFPHPLDFTEMQKWKNEGESGRCCWTGGAVTRGLLSPEEKSRSVIDGKPGRILNASRVKKRAKGCQSTDPAFFTLETLCLFTRKARWMASSVLWGMFLSSASRFFFQSLGNLREFILTISGRLCLETSCRFAHLWTSSVNCSRRNLVRDLWPRPVNAQTAASQEILHV